MPLPPPRISRSPSSPPRAAAPLLLLLIALASACRGVPPPPQQRAAAAPAAVVAPELPPALRLPEAVRPTKAALDLTIDPRQDKFSGRASYDLELTAATSTIWLHAVDLEIMAASVTVKGAPVAARAAQAGEDLLAVRLEKPAAPGEARVVLDYRGKMDATRSQGLYRQAEGEDWYAYTLFEPLQARRAFPCFDEPGFKIPWQITAHVHKGEVALANSPVEKEEDEAGGMKKVVFATSKPMPSYLVALVVGPFDVVDAGKAGKGGTALRFVVPRGRRGELRYASEVTPKIVALLEEYMGIPYPYEKLDIAVVPRYWGTMEHPGLVALGQTLSLIPPAEETTWRKQAYANLAAHELAHIWFGDYVTMKWWDDTWLNEALATWMDRKITEQLEPTWLFGLDRLGEIDAAMAADSLPSARRVREPVASRHDITAAFDAAITYSKGGAVLGMLEGWLGEAELKGAIQDYLRRHAWKSTSADDLLAVLSEKATPAAAQALRSFLDQPGVPVVSAELRCAPGEAPKVALSQRRFLPAGSPASPQRWEVPVCLRYPADAGERRACSLLAEASAEVPLEGAAGCPAWIVANAGASGYYRVKYDDKLLGGLLRPGAKALSPVERMGVALDLTAFAHSGDAELGAVLGRLPALLDKAEWPLVLQAAEVASSVRRHLVPAELRPNHARFIRRLFGERARSLGWKARAREKDEAERLRPSLLPLVAIAGEDPQLAGEARRLALAHLDGKPALPADMVGGVLKTAARRGDRALFDRILAAARSEKSHRERARLLGALGDFRAPELARAALDLLLDKDIDPRESGQIGWALLGDEETAQLAYDFLKSHFEALAARSTSEEAAYLLGVGAVFCDEAHRADVAASFGERAKKLDGGPQVLARALEEIDACVAHRKAQQASVEAFLKKQ